MRFTEWFVIVVGWSRGKDWTVFQPSVKLEAARTHYFDPEARGFVHRSADRSRTRCSMNVIGELAIIMCKKKVRRAARCSGAARRTVSSSAIFNSYLQYSRLSLIWFFAQKEREIRNRPKKMITEMFTAASATKRNINSLSRPFSK